MMLKVIYVFISYSAFSLIRILHNAIQRQIWWRLNGVKAGEERAKNSSDASQAAHVLDIVWRNKIEPFYGAHVDDFLLHHNSFTSLSIILRDSVTLYAIDSEKATFVQTGEDVTVWRSKYGTFLSEAQYLHAKRVIIIYRDSFNTLLSQLNSIEQQQPKIIFIHNVMRCGGTLLLRTFECTNKCVTFCEPSVIDTLNSYWLSVASEESDWLVRFTMRMICKPVQEMPTVDAYVIKARPSKDNAFHFTRILGGDVARHLFIYRKVSSSARSHYKLRYCSPYLYVKQKLVEISPKLSDAVSQFLTGYNRLSKEDASGDVWQHIKHPLLYGIRFWMMFVSEYVTLRKKNFDIAGVLYEDFVSEKRKSVEEIFHYCELPENNIQNAMEAFKMDSQENSRWNQKAVKQIDAPHFTSDLIEECNKICDGLGLPHIDGDCRLEGVITGKKRFLRIS